ncbi:MAG TPA: DUF2147 domain-containing protein [Pedobacter sp.]|jgi:uncharacterized protein (DUF2147 family)
MTWKLELIMKAVLLLLIFSFNSVAKAQSADDVTGKWQSAHGNGKIQIYKRGDLYFGKIIWLKEPNDQSGKPKLDIENPSKEAQSNPVVGLEVLKGFIYKGDGLWTNGKIYDPKSGNTYNGQMNLNEPNKLNIRSFFGLSILGRTETWSRVEQ